jgi:enamine deaminase RidA (YjgF/YER057c/UK114 family)
MQIKRFSSTAKGRSRAVTLDKLAWIVSNAKNTAAGFSEQAAEMFSIAAAALEEVGSARDKLLSVQVFLTDMSNKDQFDQLWNEWIGDDPSGWPQRACICASLAPGLLVEMIIVAAVT